MVTEAVKEVVRGAGARFENGGFGDPVGMPSAAAAVMTGDRLSSRRDMRATSNGLFIEWCHGNGERCCTGLVLGHFKSASMSSQSDAPKSWQSSTCAGVMESAEFGHAEGFVCLKDLQCSVFAEGDDGMVAFEEAWQVKFCLPDRGELAAAQSRCHCRALPSCLCHSHSLTRLATPLLLFTSS